MGIRRKTGVEQLEWAARNMHQWPDSAEEAGYVWMGEVRFTTFGSPTPPGCVPFSRQRWFDRRATPSGHGFWCSFWKRAEGVKGSGEVLGDWRDTLERRPEQPLSREQALQWAVDNVETWHKSPLGNWPAPYGWGWEQACGNIYLMRVGEVGIGEMDWKRAKPISYSLEFVEVDSLDPVTLHTIHHAAFLHRDCQLLLNEPELVVFRTADGELIHCKPKECLIDPDVYGLAARLLADMSGSISGAGAYARAVRADRVACMSNYNTGGPAFPQPCTENGYAANSPFEMAGGGMTLRDYFAAKAMQSLMAGASWQDSCYQPKNGYSIVENHALLSYEMADAMLKIRDEVKP